MVRALGMAVVLIGLSLTWASRAEAENVPLACSSTQGGQPTMYIRVDVANARVTMESGTFAAVVTDQYIRWATPATNLYGGHQRATTYFLDRQTGNLNFAGSDFADRRSCQRGERPHSDF